MMKTAKILVMALFVATAAISYAQKNIDALLLNKEFDKALGEIEKEIKKKPSAEIYLKKGMVFQNQQKYQEALLAYSNGLQFNPGHFTLNNEMAECLSVIGNNHDAVSFFKLASEIEPDNLYVKGKLGRTLINLNKYKEAYDLFSEIYHEDSTNVFWNKQLAFCAYRTGQKPRAISLYENVLEQNPRDYSSYINLSHLYSRKKNPEKVVELLSEALNEFPDDAGLFLEFARLYFGSRQYELAMPQYEKYFNAGGLREFKIQLNYAISCYFARDEKKSMEALKLCSTLAPNDPFVLFYKSLNHKRLAEYDNAEKFMKYAIEMAIPEFLSEMYHHLGQIHGQQREFIESVEALNKAYELDPAQHEILFEIATTYEEFNSNKTLALNYYQLYLKQAGESGKNINYALDRITKIKEDLFFEE